jgi:hypothetical protein
MDALKETLSILTVKQLGNELKRFGLPKNGTKHVLIERLAHFKFSKRQQPLKADILTDDSFDNKSESETGTTNALESRLRNLQLEIECLKKQNELSELKNQSAQSSNHEQIVSIVSAISNNQIHIPEPSTFDGNHLKFNPWRASFRVLIENRCSIKGQNSPSPMLFDWKGPYRSRRLVFARCSSYIR